ncbi:MAG: LCP family protein [Lachnospiraceae bacterium]
MRKVIILIILACIFCVPFGVRMLGKNSLYQQSEMATPTLENIEEEVLENSTWQDGWVRFNGDIYEYNDDILTFLFLGIDEEGEVEVAEDGISGGQSDAMFLLIINPDLKDIKILSINRNTMAKIAVYDEEGLFVAYDTKQITLQHGYGDGRELSCERTVEAVSNLLYGIPIHGYASINMSAITTINDAVGGVEVTLEEDFVWKVKGVTYSLAAGEAVSLQGMDAFYYVKYRDYKESNTADERLERQKQYMKAFLEKAMIEVKKDITMPVKLFQAIESYMVTSVSLNQFSYLLTEYIGYDINLANIYQLPGETITGEVFEEYIVDEEALYELMIELFYQKVEEGL